MRPRPWLVEFLGSPGDWGVADTRTREVFWRKSSLGPFGDVDPIDEDVVFIRPCSRARLALARALFWLDMRIDDLRDWWGRR